MKIIFILFSLLLCCCSKYISDETYNNKNLSINIPDDWITNTNNIDKNLLLTSILSYDNTNSIKIYKNNNKEYSAENLIDIINNFDKDKSFMDNKRKKLEKQYNKENNTKSTIIPSILISIDNVIGIQEGTIFEDKQNNFTCYTITIETPINSNIYDIIITASSPEYLAKEFEIINTIKFLNK